ncbi:MAG: porin [Polyangia bacterium]
MAAAAPARAQETGPLRLLVQGDAVLASRPSPRQDPEDPRSGPGLELRRVRVGDEVSGHQLHALVLFEAQSDSAAGVPFPAPSGGRLPFGGPVRATEAFVGWAPHRGFEVDAGSLRVPFGLSRQTDEADLRLPERPVFADALTADFRTGVSVGGDLGEILYRAAILSADRTIEGHLFDAGFLAAGRIVAEPLGPVGLRAWRRGEDDPWYGWFRFAAGLSVQYGTIAAPKTLAIDPELTVQWRWLVISAEYFVSTPLQSATSFQKTGAQGGVLEPGVTLLGRRLDVVARTEWEQTGGTTMVGAGAAVTAYAPDPRARLTAGLERRWSRSDATAPVPVPATAYWAILRLTLAID